MPHSIGQVISGRYRIVRLLGQGGMGAVYQAWDLAERHPVALKEMTRQPDLDGRKIGELRTQFLQEARVLAGLEHPGLPRVTDFLEWGNQTYLVMSFVEGENLYQRIEREGAQPEPRVRQWAQQMLEALSYCHERRVIHRDIKSQNIIIDQSGRAVIVDFGLVKLWDPSNPHTRAIIRGRGTEGFASPEQYGFRDQHTDARSDIYSLGATLYHLLTGQLPSAAIGRQMTPGCFVPPRKVRPEISLDMERVVLRAMEIEPEKRFQTAQAMLAALGVSEALRTAYVAPAPQTIPPRLKSSPPPKPPSMPSSQSQRAGVSPSWLGVQLPRLLQNPGWQMEMGIGAAIAVVGTLSMQLILYAGLLLFTWYIGLTIGAALVGVVGWFIGDTIFQALARPDLTPSSFPGSEPRTDRPTQRLVLLTRQWTRRLTTWQQVLIVAVLVIVMALLTWLISPLLRYTPLLWSYLPAYAIAGPLVYAATGRKRWRGGPAHALAAPLVWLIMQARLSQMVNVSFIVVLVAGLVGGLLIEGLVYLADRLVFQPSKE